MSCGERAPFYVFRSTFWRRSQTFDLCLFIWRWEWPLLFLSDNLSFNCPGGYYVHDYIVNSLDAYESKKVVFS